MGRTGKRSGDKIHGGEGAPRTVGSTASSLTAYNVGESAQRRGEEGDGELGSRPVGQSGRSADSRSADGQRQDNGGRRGSHQTAGPSPRCALGWVKDRLRELELSIQASFDVAPKLDEIITDVTSLSREQVGRFVGKKGRNLRKIESFCGAFIVLGDYPNGMHVYMWGPVRSCALATFIIQAFDMGIHSIVESLQYLDL